jgi:prolyl-tRNA editing enzyme YbaK/EbsC (Cys-tRNA(Pro) deacylase)
MGGSQSATHRTTPVGTARVVANAVASDATDATDAPPVLTSANLRAWIDARNDDGAGSRVELVKCPNDTPDVESSAMALGVPVDSIVKSIVFACDGRFAVCVTNGTARVDHKKIARRLGLANKRVRLATREETVAHAGYQPGTVPPFGHRTKLRTFVALDVVNDMAPDDVVFGGGGCVDVEVRCTVRDLVRLCEPCEVMDVKRDDDVSRGDRSAEASTIATKSLKTLSADVSRTAASDANDLPVPIDPSLDERTGPQSLPIAKRVADVVGQTPGTLERLSMPAWPAARPTDSDPASPHRVVTATAEVTRVRRVARFLAFATLRPLAPLRIAPKCENGDAGEEEEEEEEEEVPLAPGTTLQLIAGRTLLERMGGEAGMENTLRGLRPGAVLAVTGRLQANPRPLTVDVVSSGISFVDGTEAVTLLAHAERDGFGIDGDGSSSRTGIDSMPPGSAGVTHTAWSRHKRLDKKREKKKLAEGSSRDDDDVPGGVPMSNDELRAVLRGLRTGERVGKTSKFPALPRESVTWVDSVASIHEMRSAVLDPSTRCDSSLVHDGPSSGDDGINHDRAPWVVGLDAEWRPHKHSPVALLQVAVRHRAFLVDVSHLMKRPGDDGYVPGNEEAFDHFLRDLFAAEEIVRLGFGFGYDLQRLRRGYAGRLHSLEISESEDDGKGKREPIVSEFGETGHPVLGDAVVDVKAVAMYAFPGKQKLVRVGLATVVSSVLGAYVDKTEQCRCVYFYFHTGNVTD